MDLFELQNSSLNFGDDLSELNHKLDTLKSTVHRLAKISQSLREQPQDLLFSLQAAESRHTQKRMASLVKASTEVNDMLNSAALQLNKCDKLVSLMSSKLLKMSEQNSPALPTMEPQNANRLQ